MSLLRPRIQTASSAPNSPKGTASRTEIGSVQLPYCAARIRNTMTMPKPSASAAALPPASSWYAAPVQATPKPLGSVAAATSCIAASA